MVVCGHIAGEAVREALTGRERPPSRALWALLAAAYVAFAVAVALTQL